MVLGSSQVPRHGECEVLARGKFSGGERAVCRYKRGVACLEPGQRIDSDLSLTMYLQSFVAAECHIAEINWRIAYERDCDGRTKTKDVALVVRHVEAAIT